MENIFENAYFGKAYKTRDGRKALFIDAWEARVCGYPEMLHRCIIENEEDKFYDYDTEGLNFEGGYSELEDGSIEYWGSDIVGKWEEPIDEEKLAELEVKDTNERREWYIRHLKKMGISTSILDLRFSLSDIDEAYISGYDSGYRKAKEE